MNLILGKFDVFYRSALYRMKFLNKDTRLA